MPNIGTLRASRDGDQFHYRWAARQALQLVQPGTDLMLITIEGVAPDDIREHDGDQVIDLAEYRGGDRLRSGDQRRLPATEAFDRAS